LRRNHVVAHIKYVQNNSSQSSRSSWTSAALLFLYAVAFSLAYISLSAGVGALILFGSVQATMIIAALVSGERPRPLEWIGLLSALGGLVYLVSPGLTAPPFVRAALMTIAGISWGFYTLRGKGTTNPLADTMNNFIRSLPFAFVVNVVMMNQFYVSAKGFILAALSGAFASGVGYVIWYTALKGLTATRAAMVQLSVPVLAAAGGVILLSEKISLRLILSAVMILGGIGLALISHQHKANTNLEYEKPNTL
jgi:drug/metabolite transporter (DMT)-like permease